MFTQTRINRISTINFGTLLSDITTINFGKFPITTINFEYFQEDSVFFCLSGLSSKSYDHSFLQPQPSLDPPFDLLTL